MNKKTKYYSLFGIVLSISIVILVVYVILVLSQMFLLNVIATNIAAQMVNQIIQDSDPFASLIVGVILYPIFLMLSFFLVMFIVLFQNGLVVPIMVGFIASLVASITFLILGIKTKKITL
ncbi:MAG: hypothetical protein ACTSRW_08805 [Candidatus Helarchaeota archaeon]